MGLFRHVKLRPNKICFRSAFELDSGLRIHPRNVDEQFAYLHYIRRHVYLVLLDEGIAGDNLMDVLQVSIQHGPVMIFLTAECAFVGRGIVASTQMLAHVVGAVEGLGTLRTFELFRRMSSDMLFKRYVRRESLGTNVANVVSFIRKMFLQQVPP